MMNYAEANRLVSRMVANMERSGVALRIFDEATLVLPYGWVFFYGPIDPEVLIAGNAPFLITKTGEVYVLGTAQPTEEYLREYERSGHTHPPSPGEPVQVRIIGRRAELQRIEMMKTIRDHAGIGLGAAKKIADVVAAGGSSAIPVPDWPTAVQLAETLQAMGAEARPQRVPDDVKTTG
jgi:ribosomal protein L7/L12